MNDHEEWRDRIEKLEAYQHKILEALVNQGRAIRELEKQWKEYDK